MGDASGSINYYGYKSINELVSAEFTPLLDILLKLSNIASNFANAANNVKNINICESHQIKELLDLTFEIRRLSEKVERVVDERIEYQLCIVKSGVFDNVKIAKKNMEGVEEIVEVGAIIGAAKIAENRKKEARREKEKEAVSKKIENSLKNIEIEKKKNEEKKKELESKNSDSKEVKSKNSEEKKDGSKSSSPVEKVPYTQNHKEKKKDNRKKNRSSKSKKHKKSKKK